MSKSRGFCGRVVRGYVMRPRERSIQGQAGQIQEFVEIIGYDCSMGAGAVVVEEDDGRVFCASVGGGYPIPAAAPGGCKAKTGAEILFVGQLVEGLHVQGLKTIDLPAFRPPAVLAGLFQLEPCCLNGSFVLVQLEKPFREELTQFALDGFGLGIQQTMQVSFVDGLHLPGGRAGTESCDRPANARGDDEQGGSEDQRAEEVE